MNEKLSYYHKEENLYRNVVVKIETVTNDNNTSIWKAAEEASNIRLKKPRRKDNGSYEIAQQTNKKKETMHIIKDVENSSYIALNEEEFFVWNLLDGESTIADICHHYFVKFNKISKMPLRLIENLEIKNMLEDKSWNIYGAAKNTQISTWRIIVGKMAAFFLSAKFSLKNIDKVLNFLYSKFAWILFRQEAMFIYFILITSGLVVFFSMGYFGQKLALKNYITTKFSITLLLLFSILPVILHELSHAFACKKFKRKVNNAGLMFYVGLPVLFVETTDIWMKPRKERILVSIVGPFTDLLVGSICFLLHSIFGNVGILQLFPLVGFIAYLRCVYNFNPLLEFDGYYILMDILDIPELRKKSFEFLQNGGIKKFLTPRAFNKKEYIFLIYGIFAGIYTLWMIFFMLHVWQTQISSLVVEIWENKHKSIISQIFIAVAIFLALLRLSFIGKSIIKKIRSLIHRFYNKYRIRKKIICETGGKNE